MYFIWTVWLMEADEIELESYQDVWRREYLQALKETK